MAKRTNRNRAILAMGRSLPRVHHSAGQDLFIDIEGEILSALDDGKPAVTPLQVDYALTSHSTADRIFVRINSNGGSLPAGERIRSLLRGHGAYVTTIADTVCASAATVVLMAGDFRTSTPNCKLLLHQAEIRPGKGRWTANVHRRLAAKLDEANAALVKAYTEATGMPARDFLKEIGNEGFMSLARAQRLNLIHCKEGEERWVNGRPYWGGSPEEFISSRLRDLAEARSAAYRHGSGAIGSVAFSRLAISKAGMAR